MRFFPQYVSGDGSLSDLHAKILCYRFHKHEAFLQYVSGNAPLGGLHAKILSYKFHKHEAFPQCVSLRVRTVRTAFIPENRFQGGPIIAQVKGPKFKPKQKRVAFHYIVFSPALLTHRQDTCQARLIDSEISSFGKTQAFAREGAESTKSRREGKVKQCTCNCLGCFRTGFQGCQMASS